ncbi:phage tail protein [Nocardioides sp. Bht2]|uniref:phage tail protein n=1 Tax=Nocardioides sp. Bht2 TaxID=3392297 RepID=UPI0039B5ADC9
MSEPFVAEIRLFPFNFAPSGWALCQGQLLPISQNTALFSLLGTMYGGDGKSTFALPNLQSQVVLGAGQGPGLSQYMEGETGGSSTVTLLQSEIPSHSHQVRAASTAGELRAPTNARVLAAPGSGQAYAPTGGASTPMSPQALTPSGGGQPHNNLMPYLTLNYCIALQGIFPQRP